MAFGETSLRRPTTPGRQPTLVNPDAGILSYRQPDPGALFPDAINYSPMMVGVDFVSTDNIELQSIIAEHIQLDALSSLSVDGGLITAGTFQGTVFETSAANPKVRMDPSGFHAYNASGQALINISATTAQMDVLVAVGLAPGIRFLDSTPVLQGQIMYDSAFFGQAALVMTGRNIVGVVSTQTTGTLAVPYSYVYAQTLPSPSLITGAAIVAKSTAAGTQFARIIVGDNGTVTTVEIDAWSAAGATYIQMGSGAGSSVTVNLADATSQFALTYPAAGMTNRFIGGNLQFLNSLQSTITDAGGFVDVGVRTPAAAAGTAHGYGVSWRHLRVNAAGTAYVTPGSVTFSGVILNTNCNTQQVRGLTYHGGSFTCNSIAAGTVDYLAICTVN